MRSDLAVTGQLQELRTHLAQQPCVTIETLRGPLTLKSRHGLFSARSLDAGTELLLRELVTLPAQDRVLDLGCGYGALGLTLAHCWPTSRVDLVDTDIRAVAACRENVELLGSQSVTVYLSDGISAIMDQRESYQLVVSNLPAQVGNEALDQLLLDAYDALTADGALVVVAVNGLRRYLQRRLGLIFGVDQVAKVKQAARHTVLEARKHSP